MYKHVRMFILRFQSIVVNTFDFLRTCIQAHTHAYTHIPTHTTTHIICVCLFVRFHVDKKYSTTHYLLYCAIVKTDLDYRLYA